MKPVFVRCAKFFVAAFLVTMLLVIALVFGTPLLLKYKRDAAGGLTVNFGNIMPVPVLDLNGDGVELTALEGSSAFFDLDADGFAEQTSWVTGGDGILSIDSNGDGIINDINEAFGNATTNGFAELAGLDSNSDGVVDANDTQFGDLRVWIDTDQNGYTDSGELKTLAEHNIASINLAATATGTYVNGNLISDVSSFTRTDSTTGEIADVWFANDQMNTSYIGNYTLDKPVYFLPGVRGHGQIADLHIAMSLDSTLLDMVADIASSDLSNFRDFEAQVEAIIIRWAGVETVATNSRGPFVNGRHLAAIEAYTGRDYRHPLAGRYPLWDSGKELERIWSVLLAGIEARLLVQGPLADIFPFPDIKYNFPTDTFVGTPDFNVIVAAIDQNAPAGTGAAAEYWKFMIAQLDTVATNLGQPGSAYEGIVDSTLADAGLSFTIEELRR